MSENDGRVEAFDEGRKQQQHRLEHLVKNHLVDTQRALATTELEKVLQLIVRQFIDDVREEGRSIVGFNSIYLRGGRNG